MISNRRVRSASLAVAFTVSIATCFAFAQTTNQTAVLKESIGLTGPAMWLSSGSPGMVLVVVRGNDVVIEGYGETAKGSGKEPDGKTLIRLGSITKTFTGELLASLSLDGKAHLTDPLKMYAGGATVPSFGQREITLLDLATHSAGIPREIGDVPPNMKAFTWPTKQQRWDWLAKYRLEWEPGKDAAYSNVGFDLLADALSTAAGKPYVDLLHERITGPLGMNDTGVTSTQEQCSRLMLGSGIGGPGRLRPRGRAASIPPAPTWRSGSSTTWRWVLQGGRYQP